MSTCQSSKCLNYIDHPLVGPYFAFFMLVWGYMRHYINLRILYSILTEFATIGPFELNWVTQQYKCWISQIISFSLLAALQAVNLFWWFYICRIAWRFAVSKEARDERSEYEETEGEELGEVEGEDGAMGAATKVVESVEQSVEKMMNGAGMNGKTNGVVNGTSGTPTPQLLVNGEVPQSPLLSSSQTDDASLSSRLRPRKAGKR
jgi:acyl-CoA-dependent ceramide synthase